MSLLSSFSADGYAGGLPGNILRRRVIAGNITSFSAINNQLGLMISDTPTAICYKEDRTNATSVRTAFHYTDLTTGKTIITLGPVKTTAPGYDTSLLINPINGGIITLSPSDFNIGLQQSLDYGATWTTIYASANAAPDPCDFGNFSAGWYNGTTFVVKGSDASSSFCRQTTNGTTFTALTQQFGKGAVPGNNYSSYSGYWFHVDPATQNYRYRTTLTGSDTTVTGYFLMGMSINGRYLTRINQSTRELEYSNDGGSSWSAFATASYIPFTSASQYPAAINSNDGTFWLVGSNGLCYYYDFSASKWTSYTSVDVRNNTSLFNTVRGCVGSQECMYGVENLGGSTNSNAFSIIDFPRKPA